VYTRVGENLPLSRKGGLLTSWSSCYLKASEYSRDYGYRKVWRQGLEVALKIKALR